MYVFNTSSYPNTSSYLTCEPTERLQLVILQMNREFKDYMRTSYPDTPLSEFKVTDTYVCAHGGVETLLRVGLTLSSPT